LENPASGARVVLDQAETLVPLRGPRVDILLKKSDFFLDLEQLFCPVMRVSCVVILIIFVKS